MIGWGIPAEDIQTSAKTGLVVDFGEIPSSGSSGTVINSIALRADMDGLPMPENNQDLEYKT
jgi:metal-dependent amidase/aminoacylase/carboxypeptidase family protein